MFGGRDLDSEHVVSVVSHVNAGHAVVFGVGLGLSTGLS